MSSVTLPSLGAAPALAADPFVAEARALAAELFELLRELDPARWRHEQERALRARVAAWEPRVEELRSHARALAARAAAEASPSLAALAERVEELTKAVAAASPGAELPVDRLRDGWLEYRVAMVPAYEHLAASLHSLDVRVPSLRPSKLPRAAMHVGTAAVAIFIVQYLVDGWGVPLAGLATVLCIWSVEIGRRVIPGMNDLCMRLGGAVAHPHERFRVTSSSWFAIGIGLTALPADERMFTVAMAVLGVGDPVAGMVGRRFGRRRLANGRSIEGSLGFVLASATAALLALRWWYPELAMGPALLLSLGAAVPAALVELFVQRWDDNLTVPLAASAGAWLAAGALGL